MSKSLQQLLSLKGKTAVVTGGAGPPPSKDRTAPISLTRSDTNPVETANPAEADQIAAKPPRTFQSNAPPFRRVFPVTRQRILQTL